MADAEVTFELPPDLLGRYPSDVPTTDGAFRTPLPAGRATVWSGGDVVGQVVWTEAECSFTRGVVTLAGRLDPLPTSRVVGHVRGCGSSGGLSPSGTFAFRAPARERCTLVARTVVDGIEWVGEPLEVDARADSSALRVPAPDSVAEDDPNCVSGNGMLGALLRVALHLPPGPQRDEAVRSLVSTPVATCGVEAAEPASPSPGVLGVRLVGLEVVEVAPGLPADGALQVGDRVVAVDGVLVSEHDVLDALWGEPGRPVTVVVMRNGALLEHALARAIAP